MLGLLAINTYGQLENSNWAFGYSGGLNFSVYGVTATKGHTGHYEGSASISDSNGQLLFSTDGQRVIDRTGAVMPNGLGLAGQHSSTQAALIVPFPGTNCRKYFVFSVPAVVGTKLKDRKLYYSIVDMSLNGGMGDVTNIKNVELQSRVGEKIAGVAGNANGEFFVIAHGFDETDNSDPINKTYFVSQITSAGIRALNNGPIDKMTPFVVGSPHEDCRGIKNQIAPGEGQMKVSPNRQWIASAVGLGFVEVVGFDASSGKIFDPQNPIKFSACPLNQYFASYGPYGVEFSTDSKNLYVATSGSTMSELVMIANFTSNPTTSSRIWPASFPNKVNFAALQMAPNGNIYVARDGEIELGVIDPNGVYSNAGMILSNGTKSQWGLPSLVVGNNGQFPNCCSGQYEPNACPLPRKK